MEEKETLNPKKIDKDSDCKSSEIEKTITTSENDEKPEVSTEVENLINEVRKQSEPQQKEADDDDSEMIDISEMTDNTIVSDKKEDYKQVESVRKVSENKAEKTVRMTFTTSPQIENLSTQTDINTENTTQQKVKIKKTNIFRNIVLGILASFALVGGTFVCMYNFNPKVIPVAASVNIPGGVVKVEKDSEPVFLKGIQIQGYDVSGKTLDETKAMLAVRGSSLMPEVSLTINYDDAEYVYKNEDLNFTYDLNSVIQKAYEYNQKLLDGNTIGVTANAPQDSDVKVDKDNDTVNFTISYKVTQSSVQKVIKRVAKKVDVVCLEPRVTKYDPSKSKNSQRYKFSEGKDGKVIDQDALITDAMKAFNNGETNVSLTARSISSKPTLKMNDVKNATKLLGKFSTISTNTANATSNMATALEAMNGSIIEPGEIFSFNEKTGNSNLTENGYLPAGVISGGQMTTGVGGGICQAATTIYNAAIMANMEIVEREPHLWCSYYVYGGLDATIDWGAIDLKLKNTTKYQMFMRCWMDGVELNVEIYGWQSPDFDEVRTETELDWYTSAEYGYNSYRVFYKKGKEVKREELPYSVYSLSNGGGIRGADPGDVSTKLKQPE